MGRKIQDYLLKKIGQLEAEEQFDTCMEDHVFSDKYELKKQKLLDSVEKNQRKWHGFRSMTSIAAAAVLVVGVSVTTYAAVKGIRAVISEDKEKSTVGYQINKGSDEYIPPIEITAGYLPEGYQEWIPGKYSPDGERGAKGISIIDAGYLQKGTVFDVSGYEELQIGKAHAIVTESKGYDYPWEIILFYEEEGHVIEVFGCDELSREEMLKVCEGITYREAPENDPDGTYQAFSIESLNDEEDKKEAVIVSADSIREVNKSFEMEEINYTVTDITITDTVNTELLNENNTVDYDAVKECIQEDNTFVPFERTVNEWEDSEIKTKSLGSVPVKNVEVTLLLENTEERENEVCVGPLWYCMEKQEDGTYQVIEDIPEYKINEKFRNFNRYKIGYEMPYYFDSSSHISESEFFYTLLAAGEKKEVHIWFAIPEDELDQAYLDFSGAYNHCLKVKQ